MLKKGSDRLDEDDLTVDVDVETPTNKDNLEHPEDDLDPPNVKALELKIAKLENKLIELQTQLLILLNKNKKKEKKVKCKCKGKILDISKCKCRLKKSAKKSKKRRD